MRVRGWRSRCLSGRAMIAVLGQCVEDLVIDPDGAVDARLGGTPLFAAHALARERCAAVICARGGSEELRAPLHRFGLEVVNGPPGRTFVSEMLLLSDGQRHEAINRLGDGFSSRICRPGWLALSGTAARLSAAPYGATISRP
jgi:hypothetical protein